MFSQNRNKKRKINGGDYYFFFKMNSMYWHETQCGLQYLAISHFTTRCPWLHCSPESPLPCCSSTENFKNIFYPLNSHQYVDPMGSWFNQPWIHTKYGCFNINISKMAMLFWRRIFWKDFFPIFMYHVKFDPRF